MAKKKTPPTELPPVTDAVLGVLNYDAEFQYFKGGLTLPSDSSPVKVTVSNEENLEEALARAREIAGDLDGFLQSARAYAAQELHKLKNESWLEEGEAEVTAEQFAARLAKPSLTVSNGKVCSVMFNDGDLFWGHYIEVSHSKEEGFIDAQMMG